MRLMAPQEDTGLLQESGSGTKTVVNKVQNADGSVTTYYSDGTKTTSGGSTTQATVNDGGLLQPAAIDPNSGAASIGTSTLDAADPVLTTSTGGTDEAPLRAVAQETTAQPQAVAQESTVEPDPQPETVTTSESGGSSGGFTFGGDSEVLGPAMTEEERDRVLQALADNLGDRDLTSQFENLNDEYTGPGGNNETEWQQNKNYIIEQVENGTATPEQQQWYDDWVAAGRPETQQEMNDWRANNPGGSSGGGNTGGGDGNTGGGDGNTGGPGGNTPEEWLENKNYILSQVEAGVATPEQLAWYNDWLLAGMPETQQEMNDWRAAQEADPDNEGNPYDGGPDFEYDGNNPGPDARPTDGGVFTAVNGGNTPEQWVENKDYIVSQVESGNATEAQQAWYDRWVRAGQPDNQAAMNAWVTQNDAGANSSAGGSVETVTADDPEDAAFTGAGDPEDATVTTYGATGYEGTGYDASTYDAEGYTAEDYEAAAYDAERLGDSAQAEAELAEAITRDIDQNELSQVQLERMLASDSPLMQRAAAKGLQMAASRGLINSSMAAGAAQAAMIDAATPFAQQDAATFANQALENQRAQNRANLQNSQTQTNVNVFNAGEQNQNERLNQAAANNASQFNTASENQSRAFSADAQNTANAFTADSQNQANQFNAQSENQANAFSADADNRANEFSANAQNESDRFNAASENQASQFNAAEANQTDRFNADQQNAQDRFNAAEQNQTDRFNTEQENRGLLQDDSQEFANNQANADRDQQMMYLGAQQTFAAAQAELDRYDNAAAQERNLAFQEWSQTNEQEWRAAQAALDREFKNADLTNQQATAIAIQTQAAIGAIYADPNLTPEQKSAAVASVMNQSLAIPGLINNIQERLDPNPVPSGEEGEGGGEETDNGYGAPEGTPEPPAGFENSEWNGELGVYEFTNSNGDIVGYDPNTGQYYFNGQLIDLSSIQF